MRTPYRTVKGNHPGGGVPQEEYDRVVRLAELEGIFVPADLKYASVIYDNQNNYRTGNVHTIYEGLNLEGDEYLNYSLTYQYRSSNSDDTKIVLLKKKAGENGGITVYAGPGVEPSPSVSRLYDRFAIDDDGVLKVYFIRGNPYYSSNNYAGERVTMYDITSGCETVLSENVPGIEVGGIPGYPDTEAINAVREIFKNSIGYYTKPILENSGASGTPRFNRGQDQRNTYSLTYTLNQITP